MEYKYNHIISVCQQKPFADENDCVKVYNKINNEYDLFKGSSNIPIEQSCGQENFWKKFDLDQKETELEFSKLESKFAHTVYSIIHDTDIKSLNESEIKNITDLIIHRFCFNKISTDLFFRGKQDLKFNNDNMAFQEINNSLDKGIHEDYI
jgi:hypothetical protein